MTRRILIHPGLHKTGTTTLQDTLKANRELVSEHVELFLAGEVAQMLLTGACLEFSRHRNIATKTVILEESEEFFASLDPNDPRPILLTNESLGGYTIGQHTIFTFAALPIAMELVHQSWRKVMGPDAPFELYISTRRKGWLRSCYWQRIKSERYRLTWEKFVSRYENSEDHDAFILSCRERLGDVPVHRCDVEDSGHPVRPVFDLLGIPEVFDQLELPENSNVALGDDVSDRLVALHNSDLRGPAYWGEFQAILGVTWSK